MLASRKRKWFFRGLIWVGLAIVGLTMLWLIATNLLADHMEKRVAQRWEQFEPKFPRRDPNATAVKVDAALAKLGIVSSFTNAEITAKPSPSQQQAFAAIKDILPKYLAAQSDTLNDAIGPMPDLLKQYITTHRSDLDRLTNNLVQMEAPAWGFSQSRRESVSAKVPGGLYASLRLHNLLLSDGLEKTRQKDFSGAIQTMEAVWKINQGLAPDPSLLGQLLKTLAVNQQTIALRKINNLPPEWITRLEKWQKTSSQDFVDAAQMEQFVVWQMFRKLSPAALLSLSLNSDSGSDATSVGIGPDWRWPIAYLLQPYWRASSANFVENTQDLAQKLQIQDICEFNADAFSSQSNYKIAWWNKPDLITLWFGSFIAPEALTPALLSWSRVGRQSLHLQLTQKILQAKTIAAKQGRFPKDIPGVEASLCKAANWRYQVTPDGTMTIDFPAQTRFEALRVKEPRDRLEYSSKWQP